MTGSTLAALAANQAAYLITPKKSQKETDKGQDGDAVQMPPGNHWAEEKGGLYNPPMMHNE